MLTRRNVLGSILGLPIVAAGTGLLEAILPGRKARTWVKKDDAGWYTFTHQEAAGKFEVRYRMDGLGRMEPFVAVKLTNEDDTPSLVDIDWWRIAQPATLSVAG
jgi:hypothetical protein